MTDDMGMIRIDVQVAHPARRGDQALLHNVLVDTGAELSWFSGQLLDSLGVERERRMAFRQATGAIVERWIGGAVVRVAEVIAWDNVVFAEPGDLTLLGSRSLEGLNLMVDPVNKRLVDAGAMPAAVAA